MTAFGKDGMLKKDEIESVVDYVPLAPSQARQGEGRAGRQAKVYADNCAACHGDDGKGNQDLGAPNLTDGIWLYGSDRATIVDGLTNGRGGVMPAWGRLDAPTIKALTVYVHTLGGGK
jgi:cytochrome c oxidase cbb3-type subunit 3